MDKRNTENKLCTIIKRHLTFFFLIFLFFYVHASFYISFYHVPIYLIYKYEVMELQFKDHIGSPWGQLYEMKHRSAAPYLFEPYVIII